MDVFGTVINAQTGDPVAFVNIAAKNASGNWTGRGTQSNANGVFDLRGINATDTVHFSAVGYRPSVPLLREMPVQNTVSLEPIAYDIPEVVVIGNPTLPNGSSKPSVRIHALDAVAVSILLLLVGFSVYIAVTK
jgi:hypothetical protein